MGESRRGEQKRIGEEEMRRRIRKEEEKSIVYV